MTGSLWDSEDSDEPGASPGMHVEMISSEAAVAKTLGPETPSPWDPPDTPEEREEREEKYFTLDENDFTREELILMVEYAYTLYEEDGKAPTYQDLIEQVFRATPTPAKKVYQKIFKSNEFAVATSYRGIQKGAQGLTNKQMLTLRAVTNQLSRFTLETKLKRLGVSQAEYKAWLRYAPFKNKLTELSTNALKEAENSGDVALAQQVTQGRLDAIKYADLRSGRYDPGRQTQIDVEYVMRQMLEIIQKHVKDSNTLRAIGGELSILAGAAGLNPTSDNLPAAPVAPVLLSENDETQEVPDLWQ